MHIQTVAVNTEGTFTHRPVYPICVPFSLPGWASVKIEMTPKASVPHSFASTENATIPRKLHIKTLDCIILLCGCHTSARWLSAVEFTRRDGPGGGLGTVDPNVGSTKAFVVQFLDLDCCVSQTFPQFRRLILERASAPQ
jgi:hypothetical protein